jgi:tRNA modification GTPase
VKQISRDLKELLDSADKGAILREGITCVICGKPNVGKSSLLNALLKRDRAIVTPIPGTTRDVLEETIDLFGIPLRLVDTAGIIQARELVEKEAVKKSRKALKEADFAFLVLDASQRLTSEDFAISRYISQKPIFVVLNKQDLPAKITLDEVGEFLPGRKVLNVSALRGTGLNRLEKEASNFIWQGKVGSNANILVTNIRHRQALKKAKGALRRAIKALKINQGVELIALEIKEAQKSLGEIIGEISCEDILERIFSQFCIGK